MAGVRAKYITLAERLEQQIRNMAPGAKLPPMRSLANSYGLSMVTVNSALNLLEKKGLVDPSQGSGTFVRKQEGTRRLCFVRNDIVSVFLDERQQALQSACQEAGWEFSAAFTPRTLPDDFHNLEGHYDAIVLSGDSFREDSTFFRSLLRRNIPLVVLGHEPETKIDSVSGDDYLGMGLLFKHLHDIGHRRIALLVSEPLFSEITIRKSAFEQFAQIFGVESAPIIETGIVSGQDGTELIMTALKHFLKRHDFSSSPPFTALIATSDHGAFAAMRVLHEHGLSLKNYHVAGFDNIVYSSLSIPSLTTLRWDTVEIGRRCLKIINERLNGQDSPTYIEKIAPTLLVRESSGGKGRAEVRKK